VVKLQTVRRVRKTRKVDYREKIGFALVAALLIVLAATRIFPGLQPAAAPLTLLEESRSKLAALEAYTYAAREQGSGYSIEFEGYLAGGKLLGEIEEYGIQVFQEEGGLYIKQGRGEWVKAEELGLSKLSCFLMSPGQLLDIIATGEHRREIRFLKEGIHIPFQAGRKTLVHTLFPGISSHSVEDFDILIRFAGDGKLDTIDLNLQLLLPDSTRETIRRSIQMVGEGKVAEITFPSIKD
jgi:hypothetical protein